MFYQESRQGVGSVANIDLMVVIKRKVRRLSGVIIAGVDVKQWHSNHKDLYHYFTYEFTVYQTGIDHICTCIIQCLFIFENIF
jgi:hypothetical protein